MKLEVYKGHIDNRYIFYYPQTCLEVIITNLHKRDYIHFGYLPRYHLDTYFNQYTHFETIHLIQTSP